ncbi:hypothetical protein CSE_07730 [Caldisericum exile AZM16c01]|uniref:Uncharacterized protein n=1 Tax=Caldisericum exile (strain DSM 21853 / NBRC 104410 / AZM16c01) TaxID=511051 RepID=A0A7U6JFW2_CALEA|nr:hypothetical protein CSE_07730 [Caldisericum exile AZM16c01]
MEGSVFIIASAALTFGNLGSLSHISGLYSKIFYFLTKGKKEIPEMNASSLLFTTGIFIYLIMILLHLLFRPTL